MNQTVKTFLGAIFVLIITFSAISVSQNIFKSLKLDVTELRLYTLSDGTKSILSKLNQPVTAKLYYTKTAALKGSDQIKYFNNYFEFVKVLLEEYVSVSKGMVQLEIIDPRPYSQEELQAMEYGLQQYRITEEENFFFGMVLQTQFGVEKVISFFSPDRQNFIEYDISQLIDTAVTREKSKIGILSSLSVMGDNVTQYMAQMMASQGQMPQQPWTIVEHLGMKYEVAEVPADANSIDDIDILLVIHPKDLPEQTLFAIDQYVLKGGRTIICVDPHCFADPANNINMQSMQMGVLQSGGSDLNILLRNWGIEMPDKTFAGDREIAEERAISQTSRAETIIGMLKLNDECYSRNRAMTAELSNVTFLFSGILQEVADSNQPEEDTSNIEKIPLLTTTDKGNSFTITSSYELMILQPSNLLKRFIDGVEPVTMAYMLTGRFKSSFPDGIDIELEQEQDETSDPNETEPSRMHVAGLTEAQEDCAVVVFADVDFITDSMAYGTSLFGKAVVGENSTLLFNAIDDLSGSSDLISIRSRGNFQRPFDLVDEIERQAEAETANEIAELDIDIAVYNSDLQSLISSAQEGQVELIGSEIVQKRRELENKIYQAELDKRQINMKRRDSIDRLKGKLQRANTLYVPLAILLVAIVLGIRRSLRKRHYISHASDS
ncbi:Gldg family protein [Planctomycetota bacterium]